MPARRRKYDPVLDQAVPGFWEGLAAEYDAVHPLEIANWHTSHYGLPTHDLLRVCRSCGEKKLAWMAKSRWTRLRLAAARIAYTDPALRVQYADLLREQGYDIEQRGPFVTGSTNWKDGDSLCFDHARPDCEDCGG